MAFHCYLDDSYDPPGTGVVTLGGYFGSAENWILFENRANEFLQQFGVSVFHSIEFKDTKGCFRGWSRQNKEDFALGLFDIVRDCELYGVSKSVKRSLHRSLRSAGGSTHTLSPLSMAFGAMTTSICVGSGMPGLEGEKPTHFFVESGNTNNNSLRDAFEANSRSRDRSRVMLSLSFLDKDSCRAIQLADFCAYYSRKIAKKLLTGVSDRDLLVSQPDAVKIAFTRAPHFIEVSHGRITQDIEKRGRTVNVGQTRSVFLGPSF